MAGSLRTFRKQRRAEAAGAFAAEAAGLDWLRAAEERGGALIARVVSVTEDVLELELLADAPPTRDAARRFGAALAATHDAGAAGFGAPPDGWDGSCFLGRQDLPTRRDDSSWGRFYAEDRVLHYLGRAETRGHVDAGAAGIVRRACDRIAAGDFDDGDRPARLHGDLWNGNVIWTADGVVLIDPAAAGGHRESDLAMLDLFGCPLLEDIVAGYQEAHPLEPGWRDRLQLHQLHPLAVHAASHGASYSAPLVRAAEAVLAV